MHDHNVRQTKKKHQKKGGKAEQMFKMQGALIVIVVGPRTLWWLKFHGAATTACSAEELELAEVADFKNWDPDLNFANKITYKMCSTTSISPVALPFRHSRSKSKIDIGLPLPLD